MGMRVAEQVAVALDADASRAALLAIVERGSKRAARIVSERFGLPRSENDLGQFLDILRILSQRGLTDSRQERFLRVSDPRTTEAELMAALDEWGDFKHQIYPCELRAILEHRNLGAERVGEIRLAMEQARVAWEIRQGWKEPGIPPHRTRTPWGATSGVVRVDRWIDDEASA